jgi:hypothetical protein
MSDAVIKMSMPGFDTTMNMYASMDNCDKDNLTWFNGSDGKLIDKEGATKCDPSDPNETYGTWALLDNDKKLKTVMDGDESIYDILTLTETTLKNEYVK